MIFISTGGIKDKTAVDIASEYKSSGIYAIELSGGQYSDNQLERLKKMTEEVVFQVHNYFPPPKNPFVLNLASLDEAVAKKSMEHIRTAITWCIELNRPKYSFHAGFLVDPSVNELGKKIKTRNIFDRKKSFSAFVDRVCQLAIEAEREGVELLIENNVVSKANYESFGEDVFLLGRYEEAEELMRSTPDNVGLLIDVAHLKVSAMTLGFDPKIMLNVCDPWIRAYHLSDNDGFSDSNEPVSKDSWFWPYIKKNLDYYSLEVYGRNIEELIDQYNLTVTMLDGE